MKEKIIKIHSDLNDGKITVSQATEQVLDLLAVSDSLLTCKKCKFNMGWDIDYNCFNCGEPFESNDR